MKKFQKTNKITCLFVAFGLLAPTAQIYAYDDAFRRGIINEVLNSFEVVEKPKIEKVTKPKEGWEAIKANIAKLWTKQIFPDPHVSQRERLELAFEQLPALAQSADTPVTDMELLSKLEILQGGRHGGENLVRQVTTVKDEKGETSFLATTAGLKLFSEFISMPTTDVATVQTRQRFIKTLVEDDALRRSAFGTLSGMKKGEPYLFEMMQKEGLSQAEQALYPGAFMKFMKIDEIPALISLGNLLYATYPVFLQVAQVVATPLYLKYAMPHQMKLQFRVMGIPEDELDDLVERSMKELKPFFSKVGTGLSVYTGITQLPQNLALAGSIKSGFATLAEFQKRLINVATYVRGSLRLIKEFAANEQIIDAMPELAEQYMAYVNNTVGSARFQKLIELFKSATFDGPEPSFASSPGNILVAYKLMSEKETRADFARLFDIIGQFDVFVALAQKIKAHQGMNARFSFVRFDQKSDKPYIEATALWNPFISASNVVTNDFSLNTGKETDILLTGPNTSGKSTFIKAVMISLLMAQSFGIAPTSSMIITPFAKLISYMSITDDVAAGISQFKAEVIRANQLKEIVQALQPNEFAFFILDEIFTGTAPEQAEQLSHAFIQNLAKFKNVLFINATHFKKLAELEQETKGVVKNYHLGAEVDAQGKVIKYTRQLVPGVAQYSSAEQVAKEGGITEVWSD